MKHVVIDPGHGKRRRPVYADGACETDIVWEVALLLAGLLVKAGHKITLTKASRDASPFIRTRKAIRGDVFVSLHTNAAAVESVTGITSFFYGKEAKELWGETQSPKSRLLAQSVSLKLAEETGLDLRGVSGAKISAKLGILRGSKSDATILVECGFLTNANDRKLMASLPGKQMYAAGVAAGIERYFSQ